MCFENLYFLINSCVSTGGKENGGQKVMHVSTESYMTNRTNVTRTIESDCKS